MRRLFAMPIATAAMFATPALAGTDWDKECASYGLTPGAADFKDCVASMTDADKATNGTMMQNDNAPKPNAARVPAQIQTDIDKPQAQMRVQTVPAVTPSGANARRRFTA